MHSRCNNIFASTILPRTIRKSLLSLAFNLNLTGTLSRLLLFRLTKQKLKHDIVKCQIERNTKHKLYNTYQHRKTYRIKIYSRSLILLKIDKYLALSRWGTLLRPRSTHGSRARTSLRSPLKSFASHSLFESCTNN